MGIWSKLNNNMRNWSFSCDDFVSLRLCDALSVSLMQFQQQQIKKKELAEVFIAACTFFMEDL